jgi:hypothetical protein
MGFLCGGGIVPSALGHWAEGFSFSSGFALLGVATLILFPFFRRLTSRLDISR